MEFNAGPRATPLYVDGQLIAIGVSGVMHCLDAKSGAVQWKHEVLKEFEGTALQHGYASSPIAYGDKVIALVGGKGHAVVAFHRTDGSIAWQRHDFDNSYSSPKLLRIDGEDHLVFGMAREVVGLDPATGELRWKVDFGNSFGQNILMPELLEGNILFVSAPETGTAGYRITKTASGYTGEQIWKTRKMQFHHVNAVRVGDYVYGSSGTGPNFFSAINAKTGELAWRERGIPKANCVYGDGHFLILDEEGTLHLATATPEKFTVLARAPLLEKVSWTVPTLVGRTLYVRDLKHIMALDLG
jgi:outer membrane protein assembly factor BamB